MDWEINKSELRCAQCNKAFEEKEEYHSALYDSGVEFSRKDFCVACWPQVSQDDAFSFWKTRVPLKEEEAKKFVADDVIYDFFVRLENEDAPLKRNFRYVLGLFLMRKRLLKFKDVERSKEGEALVLYSRREDRNFVVLIPQLTEEEIVQVTEEVGQILNIQL